jgi:TolA-binding protein
VSRIFFTSEQSEQLNQALSQLQTSNERIESLENQVHTLEEENKSLREENAAIKGSTPEALSKGNSNKLIEWAVLFIQSFCFLFSRTCEWAQYSEGNDCNSRIQQQT